MKKNTIVTDALVRAEEARKSLLAKIKAEAAPVSVTINGESGWQAIPEVEWWWTTDSVVVYYREFTSPSGEKWRWTSSYCESVGAERRVRLSNGERGEKRIEVAEVELPGTNTAAGKLDSVDLPIPGWASAFSEGDPWASVGSALILREDGPAVLRAFIEEATAALASLD